MQHRTGVYFRSEDYASFWVRLFIAAIDAVVLGAIWLIFLIAFFSFVQLNRTTLNVSLATAALIAFGYLVLLKRTAKGTVGYRLAKVRIIGIDGNIASIGSLTLRMLFFPLGPLNWLFDIGWISGDPHRQSLRDKLARTYVVKRTAVPAGSGNIAYQHYDILGYNLIFEEVQPHVSASVSA